MTSTELETGEAIVWKGRPAYHLRYPLLAFIFFIGIFVIKLGPIGQAIGAVSTILWLLFLTLTLLSLAIDSRTRYYLTSRRVMSRKASMLVPDLSNVRVVQSALGRLRGTGNVYFDSRDGKWLVFKHVKDAEQIRQSGLSIGGQSAPTAVTVICNYCGARVPAGTAKCSNCGADMK